MKMKMGWLKLEKILETTTTLSGERMENMKLNVLSKLVLYTSYNHVAKHLLLHYVMVGWNSKMYAQQYSCTVIIHCC